MIEGAGLATSSLATLRLAGRFFRCDLRSAQFLVIGLAVIVAVARLLSAVPSHTR